MKGSALKVHVTILAVDSRSKMLEKKKKKKNFALSSRMVVVDA